MLNVLAVRPVRPPSPYASSAGDVALCFLEGGPKVGNWSGGMIRTEEDHERPSMLSWNASSKCHKRIESRRSVWVEGEHTLATMVLNHIGLEIDSSNCDKEHSMLQERTDRLQGGGGVYKTHRTHPVGQKKDVRKRATSPHRNRARPNFFQDLS